MKPKLYSFEAFKNSGRSRRLPILNSNCYYLSYMHLEACLLQILANHRRTYKSHK